MKKAENRAEAIAHSVNLSYNNPCLLNCRLTKRSTKNMLRLKFCSFLIQVCLAVACDPLAPDPTRIVIVLTSTATRTPVPTPVPLPTDPPSPQPPTETPTATPWICGTKQGQIVNMAFSSRIAKAGVPYRVYL